MSQPTLIQKICHRYVLRVIVFGLKGEKRDEDAIAYFVGVANGLDLAGDKHNSDFIGRWTMLSLAFRGYSEVERLYREAIAAGVVFGEYV